MTKIHTIRFFDDCNKHIASQRKSKHVFKFLLEFATTHVIALYDILGHLYAIYKNM